MKISSLFQSKKPVVTEKVEPIQKEFVQVEQVSPQVNKESQLRTEKLVSDASKPRGGVWKYPPLSLLSDEEAKPTTLTTDVKNYARIIELTAEVFGLDSKVIELNINRFTIQFLLEMSDIKEASKYISLTNEFAYALNFQSEKVQVYEVIEEKTNLIAVELQIGSITSPSLKTVLSSTVSQKSKSKLTVFLGLDKNAHIFAADIKLMPHMLITSMVNDSITNFFNSIIMSLLFRASPAEVKLVLIDTKRVELNSFNGIPHLMTPVIVEPEKVLSALKWSMGEMDRRFKAFSENGIRNIEEYNELNGYQALPYILIMINEFAEMAAYAPIELEDALIRIAKMGHSTGVHLIIATQNPHNKIFNKLLQAPISVKVVVNKSSQDNNSVNNYELVYSDLVHSKPVFIFNTSVKESEIKMLIEFLRMQGSPVEYTEEVLTKPVVARKDNGNTSVSSRDALFENAVRVVCQHDRASASLLQRRLQVGYSRAAKILDELEEAGIVGPGDGAKPRDVLTQNAEAKIAQLNKNE